MAVPVPTPDGSPRRLLQQSTPPLPGELRPLGGADPDALRRMVQEIVQATLDEQFTHWTCPDLMDTGFRPPA